jgi:hypothetical protein
MAKTILDGTLVSGSGLGGGASNPLHSHAGRLIAFLISHDQTSTQTVTFYDATSLPAAGSELAQVHVGPEQVPCYVRFPREAAIPFSTGLSVDAGTHCEVLVWSIDYG